MASDNRTRLINEHYGRADLFEVILDELRKAGVDPAHPTTNDLAMFDHFHGGGKAATLGLVELASPPRGARILDVGGGYGGPARTLAELLDAHVTVLDLTEEFIRMGQKLTDLTGLNDRVRHQHGDALEMPFADGSFDVVWSQNATMNLPDKPRFFHESFRVLRSGGRLAVQDVMAGAVQPILFPTPFAHDASICFLRNESDTRAMIETAGFRIVEWLSNPVATPGSGSKAGELVRHMDVAIMVGTRNYEEGRITQAWYVAERA